jgi:hypothetical protein
VLIPWYFFNMNRCELGSFEGTQEKKRGGGGLSRFSVSTVRQLPTPTPWRRRAR